MRPMESSSIQVGVLGAGSFGTVLANIIAGNGYPCALWMRETAEAQETQESRVNHRYLPDLTLEPGLQISSDLSHVASQSDFLIVTVPSHAVRELASEIAAKVKHEVIIISGTKGMEPGTADLMSTILAEEIPHARIGVLSGPNLAQEIAAKQISGTVIASDDTQLCELTQQVLGSRYFRVYSNDDMIGVELAGALKNIYAILSGIGAGAGFGANSLSMVLTRGLAEMSRYATHFGANPASYLGLSGVGDLVATCTSPLSRNYQIGQRIGHGMSLEQASDDLGQTAEGINTVKVVHEKAARLNISMPLVDGLYQILFEGRTMDAVINQLMDRDQKQDVEYKVICNG
jgi:glycerol-3-phosphate dehydrogenase (NAD(P)+)